MSSEKERVLERIRAAVHGSADPEPPAPVYHRALDATRDEILALFVERAADYRATVRVAAEGDAGTATAEILAGRGVRRLVAPDDLPESWHPAGVELARDVGGALTYAEIDASDGVITGCAWAIAATGTLILDGGVGQGRRVLTLLPDYHLCVVRADQVVGSVPEAVAAVAPAVRAAARPVTLISGPSATSDIELNRVEGVHGPRTLDILVIV